MSRLRGSVYVCVRPVQWSILVEFTSVAAISSGELCSVPCGVQWARRTEDPALPQLPARAPGSSLSPFRWAFRPVILLLPSYKAAGRFACLVSNNS